MVDCHIGYQDVTEPGIMTSIIYSILVAAKNLFSENDHLATPIKYSIYHITFPVLCPVPGINCASRCFFT